MSVSVMKHNSVRPMEPINHPSASVLLDGRIFKNLSIVYY